MLPIRFHAGLPKAAIEKNKGICLMGQINTTNLPEYISDTRQAGTNSKKSGTAPAVALPASAPQDDMQLTKLSGVLNSLKKGASSMRSQLVQVMSAVQSGTYEVDPIQVSRSIVGESLASR
jgi:anti-sigma28 factor (negative regulator of flagellin synthesis)